MSELDHAVLTTREMYAADAAAIISGVPGAALMENAGAACAREIMNHYAPVKTAVLAGPGNNGGDGFVIARHLAGHGWPVTVWCMGTIDGLSGDAARMAKFWQGKTRKLSKSALTGAGLVVDAIFGAGLTRPLDGMTARLASLSNESDAPVIAIDVPSGVDGDTGHVSGPTFSADRTITFFRKKPAHLLLPAKQLCGEVVVADIGIPAGVLTDIAPRCFENRPGLWDNLPGTTAGTHKYSRGAAIAVSGPAHQTGAARLAAVAALRAGAGLVILASPVDAVGVNAAHLTSVMIEPVSDARQFEKFISDKRYTSLIIGPGMGVGARTRGFVRAGLTSGKFCVLDADALTSFEGLPDELFLMIKSISHRPVVLTPHMGEFARLFPEVAGMGLSKLDQARNAAEKSGAHVVLKGADTVVAAPSGRAAINSNAPSCLATAGSGDVLAGIIGGLLAQNMRGFEAACTGVWLHGECGRSFGPGLIAEDLPALLPEVLSRFSADRP